jgi:hypothetical protein
VTFDARARPDVFGNRDGEKGTRQTDEQDQAVDLGAHRHDQAAATSTARR